MTTPPPIQRRHARQQLVLKVEFDDAEGFRSNYLSDLSEGGVRINMSMEVGERILLNISFLGFVEPVQIEAVVQWAHAEDHPEGPSSGLAFVEPSADVRAWISEVLEFTETNLLVPPAQPSRVLLLEAQAFLREIYGQEVRNWAELRDQAPLDFVALENLDAWLEAVDDGSAMLGIIDLDGLPMGARSLYEFVRGNPISSELPLIVIGSAADVEVLLEVPDDLLFCLRKPLRFGVLMNTVRVLARDPLVGMRRAGTRS